MRLRPVPGMPRMTTDEVIIRKRLSSGVFKPHYHNHINEQPSGLTICEALHLPQRDGPGVATQGQLVLQSGYRVGSGNLAYYVVGFVRYCTAA